MVIHCSQVSLLVVNRLHTDIFGEPDETLEDTCRFPKLLCAAPATFAKTTLHVLAMNQVLVDPNKQLCCLNKLLDQMAVLLVLSICDRPFLEFAYFDSLLAGGHLVELRLCVNHIIRKLHMILNDSCHTLE